MGLARLQALFSSRLDGRRQFDAMPSAADVAFVAVVDLSSGGRALRRQRVARRVRRMGAGAEVIEDEQARGRRQVAGLAFRIDDGDKVRDRQIAGVGDVFQGRPEIMFEADAGLVAGNGHGAFHDQGFHRTSSVYSVTPIGEVARPIVGQTIRFQLLLLDRANDARISPLIHETTVTPVVIYRYETGDENRTQLVRKICGFGL
jgi:hypothetical protein